MKVQIVYDEELRKITKVEREEALVSEGIKFVMFLKFIFDSYPKIPKRYPTGSIGLLLNGRPPAEYEILNEGDEIKLSTSFSID